MDGEVTGFSLNGFFKGNRIFNREKKYVGQDLILLIENLTDQSGVM